MNVSMPAEVRRLVAQAAISTAARERRRVDDSAWVVRAVLEQLAREWSVLGLEEAMPEVVRVHARRGGVAATPGARPTGDTFGREG